MAGSSAAAGKVPGAVDVEMPDLCRVPVASEDEPPVADDPAPDTRREGDVDKIPAACAGPENHLPQDPRVAVVREPDGESELIAKRTLEGDLPEREVRGPDHRPPPVFDGPGR